MHEINNYQQQKMKDLLDGRIAPDAAAAGFKTCTCRKPRNGSKKALMGSCHSCDMGVSMQKACCHCVGGFAADCAALCCCPACAVISLLAFMVFELPSALASRMIAHVKKRRLFVKGSVDSCSRNRDEERPISTPTRSHMERCKGGEAEAIHMIHFDTENLMKHFNAEHVGFGCLSEG